MLLAFSSAGRKGATMNHRPPVSRLLTAVTSYIRLAIPLLLTQATPCLAEGSPNSLEDSSPIIVVTANRIPTERNEIGSSATVVSRETIERKKHKTVLEVLRNVPGLEVSQIGGPGRTTGVLIRGNESDHTLVLIDGVRVNDNTSGQFDFANLKTDNIERIEIIRGPQSVLYGAEAVGGVIQIFTKTGRKGVHASASAEAGSHGTQGYSATVELGTEVARNSTTISYLRTDGISAATSSRGNQEEDFYDSLNFSSRNSLFFLEDGQADIVVGFSSSTTELDGFDFELGPVDDPNAEQDTDSLNASLRVQKPLTEWITPRIEIGFFDNDTRGSDPDTPFNNFTIDSQTLSTTTQADLFPEFLGGPTTLGYVFESREGVNTGNYDETREVHSTFLQKRFSFDEWLFLTTGVRYDNDSEFGEEVTYRTTLAVLLEESGSRVHTSYGTGFKPPSFNELYFPDFGNPELDAETSWGYDIGLEQALVPEVASFDITFFHNKVDDLIAFDSSTFTAANIDEAESLGVETEVRIQPLEMLETNFNYTYTDSEDKKTGAVLARRPRHRASADVVVRVGELSDVTLSGLLVNSRRDSDGAQMDDYHRFDLTGRYLFNEHIRPYVRIENLFDETYEEIPGYGTLGFSVYAGVQGVL